MASAEMGSRGLLRRLALPLLLNFQVPVIGLQFIILRLPQMPKGLLIPLQDLATSSFKPI